MSWVSSGSTNRLNSCSEPQVENSTHRGSSAKPNRLRMVALEWSRSAENVELPSVLAVPSATDRRCPSVPAPTSALITRRRQGQFPNYENVLPKAPLEARVVFRRDELLEGLAKLSPTARKAEVPAVKLELSHSPVSIKT